MKELQRSAAWRDRLIQVPNLLSDSRFIGHQFSASLSMLPGLRRTPGFVSPAAGELQLSLLLDLNLYFYLCILESLSTCYMVQSVSQYSMLKSCPNLSSVIDRNWVVSTCKVWRLEDSEAVTTASSHSLKVIYQKLCQSLCSSLTVLPR